MENNQVRKPTYFLKEVGFATNLNNKTMNKLDFSQFELSNEEASKIMGGKDPYAPPLFGFSCTSDEGTVYCKSGQGIPCETCISICGVHDGNFVGSCVTLT